MPTKTDDAVIYQIRALHKQGKRDSEIGKKLGIGKSTVQHYLKGKRFIRLRKKSDRSKIPLETKAKIPLLHAEGLNDRVIADVLDIGKSTVSGFLAGKRTINRKPTQQRGANGSIVCSICGKPKSVKEFPSPRFNGKTMSKLSFCKDCQREKAIKKLSDPAAYLRKRTNDLAARARNREIPFDLTVEAVWEMYNKQGGKCFYTDEQMGLLGEKDLRRSLSFDRVVPERGYVSGNVVLCTYKANAVKQDLSLEELQAWLPGWYQRLLDAKIIFLDFSPRSGVY